MKTITVASRREDPRSIIAPKYSGRAGVIDAACYELGMSANIVYAKLTPKKVKKLSPLARFIVENCGGSLYGRMKKMYGCEFYVYNGKSRGDTYREQRGKALENLKKFNSYTEKEIEKFNLCTEKYIAMYGWENEEFFTDGWLFPVCEIDWTDDKYFELAAAEMVDAGATKVRVTNRQPGKPGQTMWFTIKEK